MPSYENKARLYRNGTACEPFEVAEANFIVVKDDEILMTKVTDKTDEGYFEKDPIVFTITIQNTSKATVKDLVFRDLLDPVIVPQTGTHYVVTTTKGTVANATNPIEIIGITLKANEKATITILGKVA